MQAERLTLRGQAAGAARRRLARCAFVFCEQNNLKKEEMRMQRHRGCNVSLSSWCFISHNSDVEMIRA